MARPILNTVASEAHASADLKHGKCSLSSRTVLQLAEAFEKQAPSSDGGNSPRSEESNTDQPKRDFLPYHAQNVPRPEKLQLLGTPSDTPVTTLMFRNIPNKYTQNTLLREIDEFGFADTYNFFYLPMDAHNRSNVGYAFINFETPNDAEQFRAAFAEHRFQRFNSKKIGSVCTAHVQGLEENIRHFENRAVTQAKNDQYRPIVLKARQRMEFEEAAAEVKAKGLLSASPVAGVAEARQGLEAAIRDLLASSAASMPVVGVAPPLCDERWEFGAPPGLLPFPRDEPAYVPVPAGARKSMFSSDFSSGCCQLRSGNGQISCAEGPTIGDLLSSHLYAPKSMWCSA